MKKKKYRSNKLVERKARIVKIRLIIGVIFVAILFAGSIFFLNHKSMHIENILVEGQKNVQKEKVESIIRDSLEGRYLWMYSRSNIFFYPRRVIKDNLFEEFYSIENIDLSFVNNHTVRVEISEFSPIAMWCSEEKECYFINDQGLIFVKEPLIHTNQFIKYFGGIDGDPLGQIFISYKYFRDLQDFVKLLRRLEIEVSSIEVEKDEVFNVITKTGAKIIIDSEDSVLNMFDNLQTVMNRDAINKAQFGNIEYIDLRFGNRVFYKLK